MFVYNLTIKVEKEIADDWLSWLKEEHIPELMQTCTFTDNRVCHLLEQDESEEVTYVVQYFCSSRVEYEVYTEKYAGEMRQKSIDRWGSRYFAFRTTMETV
ncbi:MAG: DUF4286 family protein [Taibaiella sp.]|nr:DUF4286 family protein [Taibaiella sp.]